MWRWKITHNVVFVTPKSWIQFIIIIHLERKVYKSDQSCMTCMKTKIFQFHKKCYYCISFVILLFVQYTDCPRKNVISPFHPSFVYIHLHKPFKRSVEFSVHCVVWISFLSKFGWKGLMTCLIKILISLWLLNQIGWGFRWDADTV